MDYRRKLLIERKLSPWVSMINRMAKDESTSTNEKFKSLLTMKEEIWSSSMDDIFVRELTMDEISYAREEFNREIEKVRRLIIDRQSD